MSLPLQRSLQLRGLHWVARLALRVLPPIRAKRVVDSVARVARPLSSSADAADAQVVLRDRGTCLTRALTIAALLPGSEVVIGVNPRWQMRLHAHAWVELNHRPVAGTQEEALGAFEEKSLARLSGAESCR
jgi:hypothetical protein